MLIIQVSQYMGSITTNLQKNCSSLSQPKDDLFKGKARFDSEQETGPWECL